ncbi:MAG: NUDIX domain-containing protein [Alphaproteobacteria bacterium]|nr:NUDIX domain-containing protein [Alphaproteobacteria bacterium]
MTDRFKLIGEVHLILEQKSSVVLLRRFQTGYEDGNYSLVAGHLDGDEPAKVGMMREAREEAGISVDPSALEFVHLMHRERGDERMALFFRCTSWQGTVHNAEPHKCDDLSWFAYGALPDNLVPYIGHALACVRRGETYSEFAWR